MPRTLLITGGTGFIGRHLCEEALRRNDRVIVLIRRSHPPEYPPYQQVEFLRWDGASDDWMKAAYEADVVVNLAGENIFRPWTSKGKQKILESRLKSTEKLISALQSGSLRAKVFLQASAIGFYGDRGEELLDENSLPGTGFLARVTQQWEESSQTIDSLEIRRAVMRIGVVLGQDGGILRRLRLPFKLFLGGYPGSGKQWISWIHIHDLVAALYFLIEQENARGFFNFVSPRPVPAKEFYTEIATGLRRPCWFRLPASILNIAGGAMARELILSGQKVLPTQLLKLGYRFQYPDLSDALRHLFRS